MTNFDNDKIALEEVSDGNIKAYRYLFDNHFPDLCNFLLIYLHDKNIAEEIALDIFTYIWEKRKEIEIRSSFKTFLFAAAKNKAISFYRKEQKKLFSELEIKDFNFPHHITSADTLEHEELREIINQAINKLPHKRKMVYQMAWEQNLSYKEIAQKLDLSVKTIENHVGIALRKLREELQPYYKHIFSLWIISNFL